MITEMTAKEYLAHVCQHLPVVDRVLDQHGETLLGEYVQQPLLQSGPSYQEWHDLLDVVYQYATPLLGSALAYRIREDLAKYPVVLTTNHHGVDYFSQSIQGSLIFSLTTFAGLISATTVPVFSFGNIPLNNSTYPRGILLYHVHPTLVETLPEKLPLFPDRLKRCMVSVAPAFDRRMVQRAEKRLQRLLDKGHISPELGGPLREILVTDYQHPNVITLPHYSQQAVIVNNRIWRRLFSTFDAEPEMVYLEAEKIVAMLLEYDLSNPKSLAWGVLFNPGLREAILQQLDGVRGCWNLKGLAQRLQMKDVTEARREETLHSCGTVLFWGIDATGRRIPLVLQLEDSHHGVLRGIDDYNTIWEFPYTPEALVSLLHEHKLLPSLFTCFLTLAFARGLICVGGCLQGEYLPEMQRVLVSALHENPGYQAIAPFVARVPTAFYQDCMLAVLREVEEGHLIPAGPLEIIAGGGITRNEIEQILSLTVREAHLAALFETDMNFAPSVQAIPNRKTRLAKECFHLLGNRIVVK